MHRGGLGSQVSPLWRTYCVLLLLPKFSNCRLHLQATYKLGAALQKVVWHKRLELVHTSSVIFLKSRRGNTSFCYVSVHNIARSNSVVLCWHCQTFRLFLQEGWVQTSESIILPENGWMSSSELKLVILICSQAQTTKAPFFSATNRASSGHMVSKDASLSALVETEWQIPNEYVKCRVGCFVWLCFAVKPLFDPCLSVSKEKRRSQNQCAANEWRNVQRMKKVNGRGHLNSSQSHTKERDSPPKGFELKRCLWGFRLSSACML